MQDGSLYTAAQEMTYLDNVVQETLRLHPPDIEYENTWLYCLIVTTELALYL